MTSFGFRAQWSKTTVSSRRCRSPRPGIVAAAVSVLRGHAGKAQEPRVDNEQNPSMLLDQLAALGPTQRCEVAGALRRVSATLAEVPDGMTASHTLGVLAHLLDGA
jgi:hypothetical protein